MIVSASRRTRSYDLKTGALIWECGGLGTNVIPTPLYENGVVYVASGHRRPRHAGNLDLDQGEGRRIGFGLGIMVDQPGTHPMCLHPCSTAAGCISHEGPWERSCPAMTPMHREARFSGPIRIDGMGFVYASLVGAGGRVYISDLEGTTLVVGNGPEFEVLAKNTLDEGSGASPVVVGDDALSAGAQSPLLYCGRQDGIDR